MHENKKNTIINDISSFVKEHVENRKDYYWPFE